MIGEALSYDLGPLRHCGLAAWPRRSGYVERLAVHNVDRSAQAGYLALELPRFASTENGDRDNRRARHHREVGGASFCPANLPASPRSFWEYREHFAGTQHLNCSPDRLVIDLSTIDGDLTYVNEKLADCAGEGLPLHHGKCQPPGQCHQGRPVQQADVVRRQDHRSRAGNVPGPMHFDPPAGS
jgi:hypothetical protein